MTVRYEPTPCPACGADDATTIATREDILDEMEQLWAFHTRRLRGDMPATLLNDRLAFSQRPALRVVRCNDCGLLYRNPREHADDLVNAYREEQPSHEALETLRRSHVRVSRRLARRLTSLAGTGRGLEVGSYVGAFLDAARDCGWDFSGVDVNETANAFARARGCTVRNGTIEDCDADPQYDAVAFWNCFDQVPDPRAAALAARRRLRNGGWIAVRVPNGAFYETWRPRLHSPARPLARLLLASSNLLSFPCRHGFSIHSLSRVLESTGFRVVHRSGDTLVPLADRWTLPWAALQQKLLRTALSPLPAQRSPWIELLAVAL